MTSSSIQSLLSPQKDLLFHVIAQQNSKDAIHSVLGLNRQQLQRSELVEDALIRLCMAALDLSENASCVSSPSDGQFGGQAFVAWSHFASQMVFCYFLQLINFTSLLNKLRVKVSRLLSHCTFSIENVGTLWERNGSCDLLEMLMELLYTH